MKEMLQPLAAYHVWANQKFAELISALEPEVQTREIISSFPSLHKTLLHMLDAESIWWQRLKLQETVQLPSANFTGDTKDVCQALALQSSQWAEWVNHASVLGLQHVFHYQTLKGEVTKMAVYQVLQQVFNHGSYHRGQLVTMLRQLGISKIPQTDFSFWLRVKK